MRGRPGILVAMALLAGGWAFAQAPTIQKVDPPDWWVNSTVNPVRVLVRGQNLGGARVRCPRLACARIAVNPAGTYAFLANWGEPDCAGPESGGRTSPDAGAWVVDISDLTDPKTVGFIASSQDTRPGEGMQVVSITTKFFNGDMLVMNNEHCGKNGKGGVSPYDMTDPLKPKKLSEQFGYRAYLSRGDTNDIHSAFA